MTDNSKLIRDDDGTLTKVEDSKYMEDTLSILWLRLEIIRFAHKKFGLSLSYASSPVGVPILLYTACCLYVIKCSCLIPSPYFDRMLYQYLKD